MVGSFEPWIYATIYSLFYAASLNEKFGTSKNILFSRYALN